MSNDEKQKAAEAELSDSELEGVTGGGKAQRLARQGRRQVNKASRLQKRADKANATGGALMDAAIAIESASGGGQTGGVWDPPDENNGGDAL